jgi:hypothetical protein
MRLFRRISLFLAFAIILAVITPIFVDRSEHARAVATYAKNPSPENERALHRQQQSSQKVREREALLVFSSLFAAMIFCEWVYRASRRSGSRRRITL